MLQSLAPRHLVLQLITCQRKRVNRRGEGYVFDINPFITSFPEFKTRYIIYKETFGQVNTDDCHLG
jgi:hypothetical protein